MIICSQASRLSLVGETIICPPLLRILVLDDQLMRCIAVFDTLQEVIHSLHLRGEFCAQTGGIAAALRRPRRVFSKK